MALGGRSFGHTQSMVATVIIPGYDNVGRKPTAPLQVGLEKTYAWNYDKVVASRGRL
jgi:hypothetical protein